MIVIDLLRIFLVIYSSDSHGAPICMSFSGGLNFSITLLENRIVRL